MPGIILYASGSCDGGGGLISGSWSAVNIQNATVTIFGNITLYTATQSYSNSGGGNFSFPGLPDDAYDVTLNGSADGDATPKFISIACGPQPTSCDLEIGSVATIPTTDGLNNGKATINATGTGTIEYSLNGQTWQTSKIFLNLSVGVYTAFIRKQNQISCGDQFEFQISAAAVLGCTNPEADNYNPAATADNGTCMYTSRFYACGGVLPNPVFIGVNFPVADNGVAKNNHYVKVNIYKVGETSPLATAKQMLRNGSAQVDISRYLKSQFNNAYQEPTPQVVYKDNSQSFGFYLGIIEHYNGAAQAETFRTQPDRVAVNAALPEYTDNLDAYLIKSTVAVPENPNSGI